MLAVLVLAAAAVVITHWFWKSARDEAAHDLRAEFNFRVREAQSRVSQRMDAYEQVLRGVAGLFVSSGGVERPRSSSTSPLSGSSRAMLGIRAWVLAPWCPGPRESASVRRCAVKGLRITPSTPRGSGRPTLPSSPSSRPRARTSALWATTCSRSRYAELRWRKRAFGERRSHRQGDAHLRPQCAVRRAHVFASLPDAPAHGVSRGGGAESSSAQSMRRSG